MLQQKLGKERTESILVYIVAYCLIGKQYETESKSHLLEWGLYTFHCSFFRAYGYHHSLNHPSVAAAVGGALFRPLMST